MIIGQQVRLVKFRFSQKTVSRESQPRAIYACRYYLGIGGVGLSIFESQLASYRHRLRARKMVVEYIFPYSQFISGCCS